MEIIKDYDNLHATMIDMLKDCINKFYLVSFNLDISNLIDKLYDGIPSRHYLKNN